MKVQQERKEDALYVGERAVGVKFEGERGREMIDWTVEFCSKREFLEGEREEWNGLVENISKSEIFQGEREVVYKLIESTMRRKNETCKRRW
jgi:hypothetical protein